MDDVTALRDALLADISDPTRFDALPPDRVGHLRDRLDALIAAARPAPLDVDALAQALHADCEADWQRLHDRWGDSIQITMHGVDAHRERAASVAAAYQALARRGSEG